MFFRFEASETALGLADLGTPKRDASIEGQVRVRGRAGDKRLVVDRSCGSKKIWVGREGSHSAGDEREVPDPDPGLTSPQGPGPGLFLPLREPRAPMHDAY